MKTLIFDVDDTLYDQTVPFVNAYKTIFKDRFELPLEALFASSRRHSDEVFEPSVRGEITMEEMYIYRIARAFEDFGIQITDREALDFQEEYAKNQKIITVSEKMEEILLYCMTRCNMGIITNGPSAHQWKKVNALEAQKWFQKSCIFVSGDVGVAKPEVGIFQKVCEKMKIAPEDTYMIGDSYRNDICGAKNAGWHTIWINRRNHAVLNCEADYLVRTEDELFEVIKSLIS